MQTSRPASSQASPLPSTRAGSVRSTPRQASQAPTNRSLAPGETLHAASVSCTCKLRMLRWRPDCQDILSA